MPGYRARMTIGFAVAAAVSVGCGSSDTRPAKSGEPALVERLTQGKGVERLDLLLAVDNSRGMADKAEILAVAVPDLVDGLVNPPCADPNDPLYEVPVASPTEECPPGMERVFPPVLDMHIGIVTSSIGGHGADACNPSQGASNNDRGHLVARTAPDQGNDVETYQGKGFLAWDPAQKLGGEPYIADPDDGEADYWMDSAADLNTTALVPQLAQMVRGVGEVGCGYESQLESWYRFLVDPEPYETLSVVDGLATPQGLDAALLQQRADFLRPDSLLAILLVSDENDCSIREEAQFYLAAQLTNPNGSPFHLHRARSECATDPNDPCCLSCGQSQGDCPMDPSCYVNGDPAQGPALLTDLEDSPNVRCYDQKRRFGIDFLYPIERYTQALTSAQIANRAGEIVPNPVFSDLNPNDQNWNLRHPGLVLFAGIVGVPWQDIARNAASLIDGFKNADELLQPVAGANTTWDIILGDPANHVPSQDPFMVESIDPRSGTNPITGVAITPPNGNPNEINGTEWSIDGRNDLQYACIFDLPPGAERDCSIPGQAYCECTEPSNNPLCCTPDDADPRCAGALATLQVRAKAYPGLRQLSLIRSLGSQGVVGSVCPSQLSDPSAFNFGYRPAVMGLLDRMERELGPQCLDRPLEPDSSGQVPCAIIEARNTQGACDCAAPARRDVSSKLEAAVEAIREDPIGMAAGWDCFCEIVQLEGADLAACQTTASHDPVLNNGQPVDGWCYIDAMVSPPVGNPEIVAPCPEEERRIVRFVGQGEATLGATLFLTCDD